MNNNDDIDPTELVEVFMDKMETPRTTAFWKTLVLEEGKEVKLAWAELLKELADFLYVASGYAIAHEEEGLTKVDLDFADTNLAADLLAQVIGDNPELMKSVFKAVHESNLSKLGDDGKPIRREDGKILKGPNYKAPDVVAIVDLAIGEGSSSVN